MKFYKFLLIIVFLTSMALLYVYQETQIFQLAYQQDGKYTKLQNLLDMNNVLRYNLNVYSSLPYLDKKFLMKVADFEIPQEQRYVRLSLAEGESRRAEKLGKNRNLFADLFNIITKQAEAKPIKR